MRRRRVWSVRVAGAAVLVLCAARLARADTGACMAASDEGQKLRDDGHLIAARAQLASCAHEECPSAIRADCLRWLDDVERRTPRLVVSASSRGKDASDVSVAFDGVTVATHLDGRPIVVDPGEHHVRYEHAGDPPIEDTIVVHEGENDRVLRVRFGPEPLPVVLAPPTTPPTLGYVFTSVAIAGAISFAIFAVAGYSRYQACVNDGPGVCQIEASKSDTLTDFVIGDTSLGLGVVAAGIAVWAFIHHSAAARRTAMTFVPEHGGAAFMVRF